MFDVIRTGTHSELFTFCWRI